MINRREDGGGEKGEIMHKASMSSAAWWWWDSLKDFPAQACIFGMLGVTAVPMIACMAALVFGAVQCLADAADPYTCPDWMSWMSYDVMESLTLVCGCFVTGLGWVLMYNFSAEDQFAGLLWHTVRVLSSGSILMYEIPLWTAAIVYIVSDIMFIGDNLGWMVALEV